MGSDVADGAPCPSPPSRLAVLPSPPPPPLWGFFPFPFRLLFDSRSNAGNAIRAPKITKGSGRKPGKPFRMGRDFASYLSWAVLGGGGGEERGAGGDCERGEPPSVAKLHKGFFPSSSSQRRSCCAPCACLRGQWEGGGKGGRRGRGGDGKGRGGTGRELRREGSRCCRPPRCHPSVPFASSPERSDVAAAGCR